MHRGLTGYGFRIDVCLCDFNWSQFVCLARKILFVFLIKKIYVHKLFIAPKAICIMTIYFTILLIKQWLRKIWKTIRKRDILQSNKIDFSINFFFKLLITIHPQI